MRMREDRRVGVLIVEDELRMASLIRRGLVNEGLAADVAGSGEDALWMTQAHDYDAVVLDVMLPDLDGFEACRRLRAAGVWAPVLMLTARDAVQDRVAGLDAGADDYLVKPFAFPELLARLRALLRRGRAEQAVRLKVADLDVDVPARRVSRGGRDVELTSREFELLEYLLWNRGRVVSREMLARDVWRETRRATTLDNVIDVHIARLRRKVDDSFAVKLIQTVRGVGFIIKEGDV